MFHGTVTVTAISGSAREDQLLCFTRGCLISVDVVETHGDLYRPYDGCAAPVSLPVDAPFFDRAPAASGCDPRQTASAEVDQ
ncbi:hypothetical protein ACWGQ5_55805 [Streptomyces sp. NPDC055722]